MAPTANNEVYISDKDDIVGEHQEEDNPANLGLDTTQPDFYNPEADEKLEQCINKLRAGRQSDAILSCPSCFSTCCIECQQHAEYENQFRAMLVMNCRVDTNNLANIDGDAYYPVNCASCDAELGYREQGENGVFHFFNVLASNS